jgi:hypothetical protein
MQSPYTLAITNQEVGRANELRVIVNSNGEEIPLRIVVIIHRYHSKFGNGFRASTEFFEGNNRIDDIMSIVKNKRFLGLIEYYQREIIDLSSKDQLLLNDSKFAQEPEPNIKQRTNFLRDVARGVILRSGFKVNRNLTLNFLLTLDSIQQGLNVYTSYKSYNRKEISVAWTNIDTSADTITYINSALFDSKLASALVQLHLANVILANQLILKQTRDLIMRIEKALSYMRSRAIPYGVVIAAVHYSTIYLIDPTAYSVDPTKIINFLVPSIWPLAGFCMRLYAPKIISIIMRYTINRILRV